MMFDMQVEVSYNSFNIFIEIPGGVIIYVLTGRVWFPSGDLSVFAPIPISKMCLYNFDPLKPHFYIVKLGFTGVYIIFLISAQKHRLWVLIRTASLRRF